MDTVRAVVGLVRVNTPLKQALAEDGRRQTWLAERLGVSPRQVWGWVHGLHVPEPETQERIATVLGRPREEFWPGDEPEQAVA